MRHSKWLMMILPAENEACFLLDENSAPQTYLWEVWILKSLQLCCILLNCLFSNQFINCFKHFGNVPRHCLSGNRFLFPLQTFFWHCVGSRLLRNDQMWNDHINDVKIFPCYHHPSVPIPQIFFFFFFFAILFSFFVSSWSSSVLFTILHSADLCTTMLMFQSCEWFFFPFVKAG